MLAPSSIVSIFVTTLLLHCIAMRVLKVVVVLCDSQRCVIGVTLVRCVCCISGVLCLYYVRNIALFSGLVYSRVSIMLLCGVSTLRQVLHFLLLFPFLSAPKSGCRSTCQFRASFLASQASLNSPPFFLGSVVIIVVLSRSRLCPLWEVCA